jgi:hypothetical protein
MIMKQLHTPNGILARQLAARLIPMLFIAVAASTWAGTDFYVAPNGSDSNNGSFEAPWKTVQKAASQAQAGDSIIIRAGTYRETVAPSASGNPGNAITFQSYQGEIVTISGCEVAEGSWSQYKGNIYRKNITLPLNGYNSHIKDSTTLLANQIFVNGKAMVLARWPNQSNSDDLLNSEDNRWDKATFTNGPGKEINMVDPALPAGLDGAVVWFGGWFINRTGKIISSSKGALTFRVPQRTGTELQAFGETNPTNWTSFRRYYHVCDHLSLLDAETEWFYDGTNLYLWAPGGGAPTGVEYKQRNYAFDLAGKSFVTVRGLRIFGATINTDKSSEGIVIDGVNASHISHYVMMEGDLFPHGSESGILLKGPNSIIKNSVIKYSAGNGIYLGAPGNTASNNVVSDIDYGGTYECGIFPAAHPVNIIQNSIFRTGRCCISGLKNDIISYNDLHHYGMLNCDLGAIYNAENVDCTGGSVDHNYIHEPASWWGQFGIYTDNGSGNALIHHNVFWGEKMENCIFRNSGKYPNRIYNNTCINGKLEMMGTTGIDDVRNNIFRNWTGTNGSHNIHAATDPKFVNPSAKDYRLTASSPAVDQGDIVTPYTDEYKGTAPDIGAFEYGAADWSAGANIK